MLLWDDDLSLYWGNEIVKEYLEKGFLDNLIPLEKAQQLITIMHPLKPERIIPASQFMKEVGQIMFPVWAERPNVGFEMGLCALRKILAQNIIWSYSVKISYGTPINEQIINAVCYMNERIHYHPNSIIIYIIRHLSVEIRMDDLNDMYKKLLRIFESVHIDIYNIVEEGEIGKVYIWYS